jgi:hypothetical protein
MEIDKLLYLAFFIVYVILFYFMFNTNVESIVFIITYITTIFYGFKLLYDFYFYNPNEVVNFKDLYEILENSSTGLLLFSPLLIIIIGVSFFLHVILYLFNKISLGYVLLQGLALCIFIVLQTFKNPVIPLWKILGFPILFYLISLTFTMFFIYHFRNERTVSGIHLYNYYRTLFGQFKVLNIIEVLFISVLISSRIIPFKIPSNVLYIIIALIYIISFVLMIISVDLYSTHYSNADALIGGGSK